MLTGAGIQVVFEIAYGFANLGTNVLEWKSSLIQWLVAIFAKPKKFVHLSRVPMTL